VDPRPGLEDMEKLKFFTLPGLELDPSVIQPVVSQYTVYATADFIIVGVLSYFT
jgi:hypothetical protein